MKNNYWLRITQLLWFIPLCYHLCLLPLNPLDIQGMIEIGYMTIVGLLCVVCFEDRIGKITAWICVGVWLVVLFALGYDYFIGKNVFVFAYMIPSYRMTILIAFLIMLLVPLFLIFHHNIKVHKRGKAWSIVFSILALSGAIYCSVWTYEMQDKLARKEYIRCKEIVAQIEDYKKKHGQYPSKLADINAMGCFSYELSQDGRKYMIIDMFEHWHDRCYINYCTFSAESITYDSEMRKWKHDRP